MEHPPPSPIMYEWPLWIPFPKAWWRAVLALIWIRVFVWIMDAGLIYAKAIAYNLRSPGASIVILVLFNGLTIALYAYVHHWLFGDEGHNLPRWSPCPKSLWLAFYTWFTVMAGLGVLLSFKPINQSIFTKEVWGCLYFIALAYLFQAELIWRLPFEPAQNRRDELSDRQKNQTNQKNTTGSTDIDPVEQELNRLKAEMGINKMKRPRP